MSSNSILNIKKDGEWVEIPALKGEDGFSPTATVEKVGKVATITITDKNGTTTATIAEGGNADTVNNHTVKSDVPENAVFTDTIYDDSSLSSKVTQNTNDISALKTADNVLSSRIDVFTSLTQGSTTGDAELIDIRVKADGTTATSAGNAIREQVSELKGDLEYTYSKTSNPIDRKRLIFDIKQPFQKGNINDKNPNTMVETPLSDGSTRYNTGKIKANAGDLIYTNRLFISNSRTLEVYFYNDKEYLTTVILSANNDDRYFIIPQNATSFVFNTNSIDFSKLEIYKIYFDFDNYIVAYGSLSANDGGGIIDELNASRIHLKIKAIENTLVFFAGKETVFIERKDGKVSTINTENGIVHCIDSTIEYVGINICGPHFSDDISIITSYRYVTEVYDNKYLKNSMGYLTEDNIVNEHQLLSCKEITVNVIDFCNDDISDDNAILNAIEFSKQFEKRVIVFSNKDFYISKAIELPSNTTAIIDGVTIKQLDYVTDNIFRGDNLVINPNNFYGFPSEVKKLRNIKIIGKNGAKIIGCDKNNTYNHPSQGTQEMLGDFYGWRLLQISLSYCDGIEISGISFSHTKSWCISFDKCKNGYVHDLDITSNVKNGDGVDLRCGCSNFIIENISGSTSDDTVACSALKGASPYNYPDGNYIFPLEPTRQYNDEYSDDELSIHDVIIKNISTVGKHHGVILLSSNNLQVYNISIENIIENDSSGEREAVVKIYSGYGEISSDDSIHNIRINNVKSKSASYALLVNTKIKDAWCNKISNEKEGGTNYMINNSDGIIITNS